MTIPSLIPFFTQRTQWQAAGIGSDPSTLHDLFTQSKPGVILMCPPRLCAYSLLALLTRSPFSLLALLTPSHFSLLALLTPESSHS